MKKRIISLILVIALMSAMCLSASAASKTGSTSGGTDGILNATIELYRYPLFATASTTIGSVNTVTLITTCTFEYVNKFDHTSTLSKTGSSVATVQPSDIKNAASGISARSQHTVNGGALWGSWSSSLSET